MNKTIQIWLEYFGIGEGVLWLLLACLAFTQLFKLLLKAFGKCSADCVRPVPYVVGSFLGLVFISFDTRGVMVGVTVGFLSSIGFYAAMVYLEREYAPGWQKEIGKRMSLK